MLLGTRENFGITSKSMNTSDLNQTRVSLVIRTQGCRPRLLAEALSSVASQTHAELECIVVEDGGPSTEALLESMNARRPGLFRRLPIMASGRCKAGNDGVAFATGVWVGFLDEDDFLHPTHVSRLSIALKDNPGVDLVFALASIEACFGLARDRAVHPKDAGIMGDAPFSRLKLWEANRYAMQSALFLRDRYLELGGLCEAVEYLEDWDLWLRFTAEHDPVIVPEITSTFRVPAEYHLAYERAHRHDRYRSVIIARHGWLVGQIKFTDVANLAQRANWPASPKLAAHILINWIRLRLRLLSSSAASFWRTKK